MSARPQYPKGGPTSSGLGDIGHYAVWNLLWIPLICGVCAIIGAIIIVVAHLFVLLFPWIALCFGSWVLLPMWMEHQNAATPKGGTAPLPEDYRGCVTATTPTPPPPSISAEYRRYLDLTRPKSSPPTDS